MPLPSAMDHEMAKICSHRISTAEGQEIDMVSSGPGGSYGVDDSGIMIRFWEIRLEAIKAHSLTNH